MTASCRSRDPLRVTGEVAEGSVIRPSGLQEMRDNLARLNAEGPDDHGRLKGFAETGDAGAAELRHFTAMEHLRISLIHSL